LENANVEKKRYICLLNSVRTEISNKQWFIVADVGKTSISNKLQLPLKQIDWAAVRIKWFNKHVGHSIRLEKTHVMDYPFTRAC
jgi:hypothetical protein